MRLIDADNIPYSRTKDGDVVAYPDAIAEMPTIKPSRYEGKWIRHSIGQEMAPWGFDCSVCCKWFAFNEDTAISYRFCPNCGANIRGITNDEK